MTSDRLRLYSTAFSPLYGKFVQIVSVFEDEDGSPIIQATVEGEKILFRENELTRYVF